MEAFHKDVLTNTEQREGTCALSPGGLAVAQSVSVKVLILRLYDNKGGDRRETKEN